MGVPFFIYCCHVPSTFPNCISQIVETCKESIDSKHYLKETKLISSVNQCLSLLFRKDERMAELNRRQSFIKGSPTPRRPDEQ